MKQGGGYLGSCYGAQAASSGKWLPINLLQSYFINLPALGFLSLSSCISIPLKCGACITTEIKNLSHPVAYGLGKYQNSFHSGGPVFSWKFMNKNTEPIAIIDDIDVVWWKKEYQDLPPKLFELYYNFVMGKPIWISSEFGNGKVVVFGDHPESSVHARNDRLIHNAIFYTTSGKKITFNLERSLSFMEIKSIYNSTDNLTLPDYSIVFNDIWNQTNLLNSTCNKIDEQGIEVFLNLSKLMEEGKINKKLLKESYILHDSFQLWVKDFSESLMELEKVYNKTKYIE